MTNAILWGCSGSGKTNLSSEAVKIKISQFKSEDKPVRVIVTQYDSNETDLLVEKFEKHYFVNMKKDVSVKTFNQLCKDEDLEIGRKYTYYPKQMIRKILDKLSKSDHVTIFLCDEIYACYSQGQSSADWSDLPTDPNVVWILSVNPWGHSDEMQNFRPPSGDRIFSIRLIQGHRNCYQIRSVVILSFCIFLSMVGTSK